MHRPSLVRDLSISDYESQKTDTHNSDLKSVMKSVMREVYRTHNPVESDHSKNTGAAKGRWRGGFTWVILQDTEKDE